MSKIVHLALKVEDLEKTTEFYQRMFGFFEVETKETRDHISRHLTDGAIDFTLIKYDPEARSEESQASGEGACIHHFGIEVDDVEEVHEKLREYDCEIITAPGVIPIKFRDPEGRVAEIVPKGRYTNVPRP